MHLHCNALFFIFEYLDYEVLPGHAAAVPGNVLEVRFSNLFYQLEMQGNFELSN